MEDKELEGIINSISDKLGKEASALIADDIGVLITKNSSVVDSIKKKDTEISSLQERNSKLVMANGNLLQQLPMGTEKKKEEPKEETHKSTSLKDCFDSRGRFIN